MARQAIARAPRTRPADIEVLQPANQDVQLVESNAGVIRSFLLGLVPFFTRARELEAKAKQYEQEAQQLVAPDNGEADARIQTFIKVGAGFRKTTEEHWNICQAVSALHRTLTSRRKVAIEAIEVGMNRAQNIHNGYVERERSRVAAEEAARRREAEERARVQQEREALALEQAAIEAESKMEGLSDREELFVEQYLKLGHGLRAAQIAGYKNPAQAAERLLATKKITDAITLKQEAAAARRQAEAVRQQPTLVTVEPVKADVKAVGTDRTTWSGEVVDEVAFIHAAIGGRHGIPPDCLQINRVKLNEYARSLHERLDLWPGVRAVKTTRTV